jgi:hypothetical protein
LIGYFGRSSPLRGGSPPFLFKRRSNAFMPARAFRSTKKLRRHHGRNLLSHGYHHKLIDAAAVLFAQALDRRLDAGSRSG